MIQNLVKFSSLHVHWRSKQWPFVKFFDFLFENDILGYNGGVLIT